ncbi:DUF397 domain-containing protein [[Actinomadura] parvosata]|uniref:DUF397 domain-containing protein n=1 Tax=[Actinomadura] parvosata TaxID=1955412 RepID=UPI002E35F574|nr:DUF397 domain-containing protein [Nonomuraea sp. ATCC 55076]
MDQVNLDGADWRKATDSGDNGQCVEVATNLPGIVAVRDSKNPRAPRWSSPPENGKPFSRVPARANSTSEHAPTTSGQPRRPPPWAGASRLPAI